jgi:hypothetical protein
MFKLCTDIFDPYIRIANLEFKLSFNKFKIPVANKLYQALV